MPEHTATDNRREVHVVGETATVRFVSEAIDGQRQTASCQDGDQTLVSKRTDEAVERHGRERVEPRAPFPTEPTVGRQQRMTSDVRAHRAIA